MYNKKPEKILFNPMNMRKMHILMFFLGKDLIRKKTIVSTDINKQTGVNCFWENISSQVLVFEF